jgi:UDP-N-acetylmuramoyl-tripeptide--D-alanyl-D-alanine ligase
MQFLLSEVATVTGGQLHGPDITVNGVGFDSRNVAPGSLFVPIVAERDGHDFVAAAREGGAAAHLQSRAVEGVDGSWVEVADTEAALTAIGVAARAKAQVPTIGITGSVGKTSTKDLLAGALSESMVTAASEKSFNNEMGVPLTLANAPDDVQAIVVEMGARGIGHIAKLCDVAHPSLGIVTTVAASHTELFGSVEKVAEGKSELVTALPSSGTAVLNNEVSLVADMAKRTTARVLLFGEGGDLVAERVALDDNLCASFVAQTPWGPVEVALAVAGAHQVNNALAALGAGLATGASAGSLADGLAKAGLSPWRMELSRTSAGAVVINDAYNANPTSVEAALRSLAALDARARYAVLGVMGELGDEAEPGHKHVAALAAELGIELIAIDAPLYGVETVPDFDAATARLGELGDGDAVLVKGSRVAGLEKLAEQLLAG